ncbi:MAG: TraR/DksA C4-type zinc finger protein [Chitinophagaceae bacterium]|jgi:RNA polymerase-binding transcription factor DksA|nr:TraR/DksA C4-type zinc finger protein [Chitinophagaceae bacterium]
MATAKKTTKPIPSKKTVVKKATANVKKVVTKTTTKKTAAPASKKATPVKKQAIKQTTKPAPNKAAVSSKKIVAPPPVKKPAPVAPVKKAIIQEADKGKNVKKNLPEHKEQTPIKKPAARKAEPVKDIKPPKTSVKTSVPYMPSYQSLEKRMDIAGENGAIVRYSDNDLGEFKVLINKKLNDAKRELAYLQGLITRKDDMGGDIESRYMTMEDGTVSMEREQLSQMASRQITYIDHLEKALIRIENKTYGICRVTGRLIDKARLRAVPHATLSLEAKMGLVKGVNGE